MQVWNYPRKKDVREKYMWEVREREREREKLEREREKKEKYESKKLKREKNIIIYKY